eukprot:m.50565 g.50565  ORF g.50565 m.50565 type:complete len:62 (+) comp12560_c1_seq2:1060-1245(+)
MVSLCMCVHVRACVRMCVHVISLHVARPFPFSFLLPSPSLAFFFFLVQVASSLNYVPFVLL